MILLKKFRLINWYGFSNVTAPIGFFTLIAGKNGNGKSVLLDAMKYAAYGDTVFNKSSESTGSRTLSSYTRGCWTLRRERICARRIRCPTYTAILCWNSGMMWRKSRFCWELSIETNASNNCQTYRYVMDRTFLEEVEHTWQETA